MECSCEVDCSVDCDLDYKILIDKRTHQASRECECSECGGSIMPGETHFFRVDTYEPDWQLSRYRQCEDCGQIVEVFFTDYYLCCIWEYLKNAILDGEIGVSESCLVGLSKKNLAKVCEIIERAWLSQEEYEAK